MKGQSDYGLIKTSQNITNKQRKENRKKAKNTQNRKFLNIFDFGGKTIKHQSNVGNIW